MTKTPLVLAALTATLSLAPTAFAEGEPSPSAHADTRVAVAAPTAESAPSSSRIQMVSSTSQSEPVPTSIGPSRVVTATYMESSVSGHARSGFGVDVSARLDGFVYLHGAFVYGNHAGIDSTGFAGGDFNQMRLGLEGRGSDHTIRAVGGIDLVYQRDSMGSVDLDETLVTIPRIGVELGSKVRVRGMVELPLELGGYSVEAGLGVSLSLGAAI